MAQDLALEMGQTFKEFIGILNSFEQEDINTIPFEGSWTAGQVGRHVIRSASGFAAAMNGPVEDTKRNPAEMVEDIKHAFLDFSTKMKSPDFIIPEDADYNKKELVNTLKKIETEIVDSIQQLDLTPTCLTFEVPVLGRLTRLEAASFVLYHTQRHIHQLKNIREIVANNA